jgi:hypothetical protein
MFFLSVPWSIQTSKCVLFIILDPPKKPRVFFIWKFSIFANFCDFLPLYFFFLVFYSKKPMGDTLSCCGARERPKTASEKMEEQAFQSLAEGGCFFFFAAFFTIENVLF